MTRFIFHPAARTELAAAAYYYDKQVPGLGERFLRRVEEAAAYIKNHPEGTPVVEGAVRGKIVPRFPYSVLYSIEEGGTPRSRRRRPEPSPSSPGGTAGCADRRPRMRPRPGEVWLADLGLAAKTRPVVIVSRDDSDPPRALVLDVPLPTQQRAAATK